jgi:site-specific DNA-methyltransferase (adenine-specific)
MNNIPDGSINLTVTDPPYRMTSRGSNGSTGGMLAKKIGMSGRVFNHNDCNVKDWMPELYRVLKNGSHAYIMCNHINLIEYLNIATQCGFHFIKSLIWDKCSKIMGRAYMSQFEYILMFRKGDFKQVNDCGISDIISIQNKKPNKNRADGAIFLLIIFQQYLWRSAQRRGGCDAIFYPLCLDQKSFFRARLDFPIYEFH